MKKRKEVVIWILLRVITIVSVVVILSLLSGCKTYTMQKAYDNMYSQECPAHKKHYKSNARYR